MFSLLERLLKVSLEQGSSNHILNCINSTTAPSFLHKSFITSSNNVALLKFPNFEKPLLLRTTATNKKQEKKEEKRKGKEKKEKKYGSERDKIPNSTNMIKIEVPNYITAQVPEIGKISNFTNTINIQISNYSQ